MISPPEGRAHWPSSCVWESEKGLPLLSVCNTGSHFEMLYLPESMKSSFEGTVMPCSYAGPVRHITHMASLTQESGFRDVTFCYLSLLAYIINSSWMYSYNSNRGTHGDKQQLVPTPLTHKDRDSPYWLAMWSMAVVCFFISQEKNPSRCRIIPDNSKDKLDAHLYITWENPLKPWGRDWVRGKGGARK